MFDTCFFVVLYVESSFAIISLGKRGLVAFARGVDDWSVVCVCGHTHVFKDNLMSCI